MDRGIKMDNEGQAIDKEIDWIFNYSDTAVTDSEWLKRVRFFEIKHKLVEGGLNVENFKGIGYRNIQTPTMAEIIEVSNKIRLKNAKIN